MALRVERGPATEDDRDGFLDAAVGQGEGRMSFLGKGLDRGLELGLLAEASGVCYSMHDHLLWATRVRDCRKRCTFAAHRADWRYHHLTVGIGVAHFDSDLHSQ